MPHKGTQENLTIIPNIKAPPPTQALHNRHGQGEPLHAHLTTKAAHTDINPSDSHLPKLGSDLVSALSRLKMNDFSHGCFVVLLV
jgi:hypothetical protein